MRTCQVLLVGVLALCVGCSAFSWAPNAEDFQSWMTTAGFELTGEERFPELRAKIVGRLTQFATEFLGIDSEAALHRFDSANSKEYPYFAFIPPYMGSVLLNQPAVEWSGVCFQNASASLAVQGGGPLVAGSTLELTVTLTHAKSLLCSDVYLFGAMSTIGLKVFATKGAHVVELKVPSDATPSELYDLQTRGIRSFIFLDGITQTVSDLFNTLVLFGSELTKMPPKFVVKKNVDFMQKYRNVPMLNRTTQEVTIDESLVQSGDFLGIIRLDGLDPMLAWAMGSTTGHTTVALRDPVTNELYIAESTVKDSYWPTDGIQKTPWAQWMAQAKAAGYMAVWAPLDPTVAESFNVTAAWEFFDSVQGLEYGYHNLLFGWIDTVKDNFPCLPPNYNQCLEWQHLEVLFGFANRAVPAINALLFDQAMNLRLNTTGLKFPDVFMYADQQGIDPWSIAAMVEQDSYMYQTTRYNETVEGRAMVCCVFVCSTWKAAGLFDNLPGGRDSVNCGELTNSDDYQLTILQGSPKRPAACVAADPTNALCQVEGQFQLQLNGLSERKPYAHMNERCPGSPPNYQRPDDC